MIVILFICFAAVIPLIRITFGHPDSDTGSFTHNAHHFFQYGESLFHEGNTTQMKLFKQMARMISQYQFEHHINVIMQEALENPSSICNRTFIISRNSNGDCRGGFGNEFSGFLEEVLYAVLLNFTFVLPTYSTHELCDDAFSFYGWIPLIEDISELYKRGNCPRQWNLGGSGAFYEKCGFLNKTLIESKGPLIHL